MRPLRFGKIICVTATALLAGGTVACSGVDTPDPVGLGGSSGSTSNGGTSSGGSSNGGTSSGGSSNGGTSSGGSSNGGTSSGGSSNGGTSSGGSSNGGSSSGGTAGDAPDAGSDPDSGTDPDAGNPGPTNLVTNSDAEAATMAPWIAGQAGTVAIATDQFNSGSQSIVTVGRDATWKGVGVDLFGLVDQGTVYDASIFMRVSAASTAQGKFTARITCNGVNQYSTIQQNVAVSETSWTPLSGTFTVPAVGDCPNMTSVLVFVENVDAALQIYADDLVVMEQAQ